MTMLMGAAGLAIDLGLLYTDRRSAQDAADSAAYSAASDLSAGDTTANVAATAKAVAAQYGLVDGHGGVTVTVNQPPSTGPHIATAGAIEVVVSKSAIPFVMTNFLNSGSVTARAVAVANSGSSSGSGGSSSTSGKYCVLALDTTAATSVSTAGVSGSNGVQIDLSTCGIQINASGSDALFLTGGATLKAATASIVGNYSVSNGGSLQVSGTLTTSAPAMTDPYASVAVPTPGSCASTNSWGGGGTFTINPGTFCNGMTISNGARVTMNAGVYVVDRGIFTLTGGATLTATSGVTIVLTSSSGANYPTVSIDNGTTINIKAPASGTTKGLAFMQDRRASVAATNNFAGGASMTVQGALYFPAQMVNFSNGSNTTACLQLIAYRVNYTGGARFADSCSGFGTTEIGVSGSPATTTGLVE
jgi:Flp pilus assembly protein TadG